MPDTLAEQIEALPKMNRGQLQAKWLAILRQPAPPHLRKELLVPLLAYKLQEQAYGGLSASARRRLRELAAKYEASPKQAQRGTSDPFRAKPGTRLLRQWQGKTHHVTVLESSFEYQDSRIAASRKSHA